MGLNYLNSMAEEILENGKIKILKPLKVSEAVYLKKVIRKLFKDNFSSKISISKALKIVDDYTEREKYSYQVNSKNKISKEKIDYNNKYVKVALHILNGKAINDSKLFLDENAIKIIEAAKILLMENKDNSYKRSFSEVIDYINDKLDGKKVVVNQLDNKEIYEIANSDIVIPLWNIDNIIDPILVENEIVNKLAKILIETGDLALEKPLQIDYSLAIIRDCIMQLGEEESNVNLNNLIFYLNLYIDGNYMISYTKDKIEDLKQMILQRKPLILEEFTA